MSQCSSFFILEINRFQFFGAFLFPFRQFLAIFQITVRADDQGTLIFETDQPQTA
jgi:hypothetical protein